MIEKVVIALPRQEIQRNSLFLTPSDAWARVEISTTGLSHEDHPKIVLNYLVTHKEIKIRGNS